MPDPRRHLGRLAGACLALACLAGSWHQALAITPAGALPQLVFDSSRGPLASRPGDGSGPLHVVVHRLEVRLPTAGQEASVDLPFAWRLVAGAPAPGGGSDSGTGQAASPVIVVDEAASSRLRAALGTISLESLISSTLRERALSAGTVVDDVPADVEARILSRQTRPGDTSTDGPSLRLRIVTRGNVDQRWTLTPDDATASSTEVSSITMAALPSKAARELGGRLVVVDIVGLALHEEGSAYRLPANFLHATLRASQWNLVSGENEWERTLMLGSVLDSWRPGPVANAEDVAPAVTRTLQAAVNLLADGLWPATAGEPRVVAIANPRVEPATRATASDGPTAPATPLAGSAPPAPTATAAAAEPVRGVLIATSSVGDAETRLLHGEAAPIAGATVPDPAAAETRLQQLLALRARRPWTGDPWRDGPASIPGDLDPALALTLRCAVDPLEVAADVGAAQLGVSSTEARRRLDASLPFRRAVAADIVERVREMAGSDPTLPRAASALLLRFGGERPDAVDPRNAARPLLEQARRDGVQSRSGLAALLVGARLSPADAVGVVDAILDPRP